MTTEGLDFTVHQDRGIQPTLNYPVKWNKVAKIPRMSKSLLISKLQEIRSENFL